ncbi:CPBP family glutamic-type intramembrane protease [Bacillus sp. FJAT-29814]|uniref:CPBP family glutamic-type intramembrane protease n=1 Tax=Bacillus sp. FJAT-29814 TaxID=1729688 RepID=UPI000835443F|nr:CPBP family glutamic-type intramembrane protease [Bacillus sp. FJAT-29814]
MKNKLWIILLILLSRTIFAVIFQGIVALGFHLDYLAAGRWWTVYGSMIDFACLGLMLWVVRREGIEFRSLVGYSPGDLKRDLKLSGLVLIVVMPLTVLWATLISLLLFGKAAAPIVAGPLPLWGAIYSVIIWPIGWAIMEQIIYMGYCLPKLEEVFHNKVIPVSIVMFFWALQHIALPVTYDMNYSLYRFLTVIPMVFIPIVYLRTRRLVPLIIAHGIFDMTSAISFYFLPN